MEQVITMPPLIKENYQKNYANLERRCPTLTNTQLELCSLAYLNLLPHGQLRHYVGVSAADYKEMVASINIKLRNAGVAFTIEINEDLVG